MVSTTTRIKEGEARDLEVTTTKTPVTINITVSKAWGTMVTCKSQVAAEDATTLGREGRRHRAATRGVTTIGSRRDQEICIHSLTPPKTETIITDQILIGNPTTPIFKMAHSRIGVVQSKVIIQVKTDTTIKNEIRASMGPATTKILKETSNTTITIKTSRETTSPGIRDSQTRKVKGASLARWAPKEAIMKTPPHHMYRRQTRIQNGNMTSTIKS